MPTVQMTPPSDGSRNSVTVSGRVYSSLPFMAASVQSFDAPALAANGWQYAVASNESWAARLRRLRSAAINNNPIECPPLAGGTPWVTGTVYAAGAAVSNAGNVYKTVAGGTAAAGTSATVAITIATPAVVTWTAHGLANGSAVKFSTTGALPTGLAAGTVYYILAATTNTFQVAATAAGAAINTSGSQSGTQTGTTSGPSHIAGAVSDGAVTWTWIGFQTAPAISALYTTQNTAYNNPYLVTSANYVDNAAPFRWRGGVPQVRFGSDIVLRSVNNAPQAGNLGGTLGGQNSSMTFILEGTSCEVQIRDASLNRIAIIVNGRYVDRIIQLVNGGTSYFTIDFTNVQSFNGIDFANGFQRNTITIDCNGSQPYMGVRCLPTGTLSYPAVTDNFTAACIGDSHGGGGGPTPTNQNSFWWQLMHLMGLPDVQNCSIGGTGLVAAATAANYGGHAIADLQYQNAFRPIGLIFVQLSANDVTGGFPSTGLAAASLAFFQALRVAFPAVPIVVTGVVTGGAVTLSVHQSVEEVSAASIATLQAAGDDMLFYVPAARDPGGAWITGTGNSGAPDGTGNADFNIGTDDLHISNAGQSLYARKAMTGFLNQIASIP